MKHFFKENLLIRTDLPKNAVKHILAGGISAKRYWISITTSIINGKLENDLIKGVINSPIGFTNSFGSKIEGKIADDLVDISITVNKFYLIFIILWACLCLLPLIFYDYTNSITSLGIISLMIVFAVLPALFIKLNLKWEKWRIKNWVAKEIEKYIKYQNIFSGKK